MWWRYIKRNISDIFPDFNQNDHTPHKALARYQCNGFPLQNTQANDNVVKELYLSCCNSLRFIVFQICMRRSSDENVSVDLVWIVTARMSLRVKAVSHSPTSVSYFVDPCAYTLSFQVKFQSTSKPTSINTPYYCWYGE